MTTHALLMIWLMLSTSPLKDVAETAPAIGTGIIYRWTGTEWRQISWFDKGQVLQSGIDSISDSAWIDYMENLMGPTVIDTYYYHDPAIPNIVNPVYHPFRLVNSDKAIWHCPVCGDCVPEFVEGKFLVYNKTNGSGITDVDTAWTYDPYRVFAKKYRCVKKDVTFTVNFELKEEL